MKELTQAPDFSQGFYLTDGGLETTLIFHQGLELPHFAAFGLVTHLEGRQQLRTYYQPYLEMAQRYRLPFILETPTWRANTDWGLKLGYGQDDLDEINRQAVRFMRELKASVPTGGPVLISGNIGPRGDGYVAGNRMKVTEAHEYHEPQVQAFAQEAVDLVTGVTINYPEEGIGMVKAARAARVPVVISFTVETDGRLPGGESLKETIELVDLETDEYATHFMINCAHPQHFESVLEEAGSWRNRIRGIRANASTKSHAELDESDTLDPGDPHLLAKDYVRLQQLLPELRIFGGCCGTDHRHLEEICHHVLGAGSGELGARG